MLTKYKGLLNVVSLQKFPNICSKAVVDFSLHMWLLTLVRVLQRNKMNRMHIHRERFTLRN